jgi:hypothetical protein
MNRLTNPDARRMLRHWALAENYFPQPAPVIVPDKPDLHQYAAQHIGLDAPLTYLEFGVAHGRTLLSMLERCTSLIRRRGSSASKDCPNPGSICRKATSRDTISRR